jgi:hypothetical protein
MSAICRHCSKNCRNPHDGGCCSPLDAALSFQLYSSTALHVARLNSWEAHADNFTNNTGTTPDWMVIAIDTIGSLR